MTVREDIDEYISFFRDKTAEIGRLEVLPIYRKILYLVEIDTLSRAAFPSKNGHKRRAMKFLDECSNWRDKDRVSADQLKRFLKRNGKNSGPLFELINNRMASWIKGTCIKPSQDLNLEEVQNLAYSDVSKIVDEARYCKRFYEYRNTLIHEFREPGKAKVIDEYYDSPYYLYMDDLSTGDSSWELVFTAKFLKRLCEGCVNGLERRLRATNRDPYAPYKFETLWSRQ